MPRPIHFEIHAENPERAIEFYGSLFGWQFTKWEGPMPYWLVKTGEPGTPGIDGGLMKRMGPAPSHGQAVNAYICTIDVPDLEASMKQGLAIGAQLALAKMPIPGVGWLAYLLDTEGNLFGIMQHDPAAA